MSKSNGIEIIARPPGFVAEIRGVDLKEPLDEETLGRINKARREHGVVFFPDQDLDPQTLEAFAGRIGKVVATDFVVPMEGHPNVLELRREPEETAFHFGSAWHSDSSYQEAPPAATLLFGHIIPPVGGDTLFADGRAAYLALPDHMKSRLEGLKGIHSAEVPYSKSGYYGPGDDPTRSIKVRPTDDAKNMFAHHPIIRTHPDTGERILWMNPLYMRSIVDMSEDAGTELIESLVEFMTRDEFVYRHKWKQNTLVIWDNCRVQHLAIAGFDGHRRVMWRTMIAGGVPV